MDKAEGGTEAGTKREPGLGWAGKVHRSPLDPCSLVEVPELSHAAAGRLGSVENLLIQGDNRLVLHALQATHASQVKCVYIDPPYNTGNPISAHYDDGLEHARWLSFMRDRIELLRSLLTDDGAIFVHLDDNELDYLKVVMDELFGRSNFLGRITIDTRAPSAFSTVNPGVFKAAEYLLWYARDKARFVANEVRVARPIDGAYNQWLRNPNDDCAEWQFSTLRSAFDEMKGRRGETQSRADFVVKHAAHVFRLASISDTRAGRLTLEAKARSRAAPTQVFRVDRGSGKEPQFLLRGQQMAFYEKNVVVIDGARAASRLLTNVWTDIAWEGIAAEGGVRFKKGKKPEKLLRRCLELCTQPGDLVLDAFAGSGTTAAVAHKLGRRWIAIESGEHVRTLCVPRLRAVIDGEDPRGVSRAAVWSGGGGFRFLVAALTGEGRVDSAGEGADIAGEGAGPPRTG